MSPLSSVSQDTHQLDETCIVISSPGSTPRSVSSVMFLKSLQREALGECPNLSSLEDRDTLRSHFILLILTISFFWSQLGEGRSVNPFADWSHLLTDIRQEQWKCCFLIAIFDRVCVVALPSSGHVGFTEVQACVICNEGADFWCDVTAIWTFPTPWWAFSAAQLTSDLGRLQTGIPPCPSDIQTECDTDVPHSPNVSVCFIGLLYRCNNSRTKKLP